MTKTIDTLVEDIYEVLDKGVEDIPENTIDEFAHTLSSLMKDRLKPRDQTKNRNLVMSNFGRPCNRQLWYGFNKQETAESLEPWVKFKFLYGDIIEATTLFLARLAGHSVEGEQETLEVFGIRGKRDAKIDGVTTDVKSTSSKAFEKFKYHKLDNDDDFGYRYQLDMYLEADDADEGAFLAVDKQFGHICLDKYGRLGVDYKKEVKEKIDILNQPEPPERAFMDTEDGKSGNRKLVSPCTYCPFKKECWPELRTFIYSNGPRYLTKVEREPDVPELIQEKQVSV